jgi:hypothetical protein
MQCVVLRLCTRALLLRLAWIECRYKVTIVSQEADQLGKRLDSLQEK